MWLLVNLFEPAIVVALHLFKSIPRVVLDAGFSVASQDNFNGLMKK